MESVAACLQWPKMTVHLDDKNWEGDVLSSIRSNRMVRAVFTFISSPMVFITLISPVECFDCSPVVWPRVKEKSYRNDLLLRNKRFGNGAPIDDA